MSRLRAIATAFGILALFVSATIQADEMPVTFSAGQAAALGLPSLVEAPDGDQSPAPMDHPDSPPSVLDNPAGCFVEPGCPGCGCAAQCTECVPGGCTGCQPCYQVRFVPYGWLFAVHGDATVRGLTAPIDVSIPDTLDFLQHDVHFIFAGKLEVESNDYGLIVDGFYVKAGLDDHLRRFNFDSSFDMAIVDIAATYNLLGNGRCSPLPFISRFDMLAGLRYWQLDTSLTVTGPLGNSRSGSRQREWVDPFVGGRIIMPLTQMAEASVRGDIGGFDWGTASEFTWNLEALVSMRCTECCSLRGGYRVLDVSNHRHSGTDRFGFDVQFRGPIAEIAFEF